jgi:hypothetical protein
MPYFRLFAGAENVVALSGSRIYLLSLAYVSRDRVQKIFTKHLTKPEQAMS